MVSQMVAQNEPIVFPFLCPGRGVRCEWMPESQLRRGSFRRKVRSAQEASELAAQTMSVARIQAQAPEIQTMQGWLAAWRARPMPGGMMGHGGHQGHGGGMMNPQQMTEFQQARGETADRLFLQMMIQHHQGAVDMARPEQQQGQDLRAKQLATSIVDSQQAQITQMQHMLGH